MTGTSEQGKPKILVTDPISEEGLKRLREFAEVDIALRLGEGELAEKIRDYDALIVRSGTQVTRKIIEAGRKLKVIGRAGVGVDNIDVEAATEYGVLVINAPEANTISAAEHTVALLLSLARKIPQANKSLKAGEWDRRKYMGVEVRGKTLGIIGLGRIGAEVARMALGLGMKVVAYDPYVSQERAKELGVSLLPFDEVIRTADFLTVHVPLTNETYHMISDREFEMMKDGVRIINTARGGVIDEAALVRAIKSGKVAGAAIDVFEKEPPRDNELLKLEEVIVTPHLGASTEEAQRSVAVVIAEEVQRALRGEPVKNAVNLVYVPAEILDAIRPFLTLAERLGKFTAQIISGRIESVDISYQGEVATKDTRLIGIAMLKGFLSQFADVNYVNAQLIARKMGIRVTETKTEDAENFSSLIGITVKTDKVERTVAGTVFGKNDLRIVKIDGYRVDAVPSGYMLICSYIDKPRVIGPVGVILGDHGINIAAMQVGREKIGGRAVMVLNVDNPVSEDVLEKVKTVDGISDVKLVKL